MYPREYLDTFRRPGLSDQVFVAIASEEALDDNWRNIIEPAIVDVGLIPHRVDVTILSGNIIAEVREGIAHSKLVLGELTSALANDKDRGQRSPDANVMYEIGIAHALRHDCEVLLIRSDERDDPLNSHSMTTHAYKAHDVPGSREHIAGLIKASLREVAKRKTILVDKTIHSLNVDALALMRCNAKEARFPVFRSGINMASTKHLFDDGQGEDVAIHEERIHKIADENWGAYEPIICRLLDLGIVSCNPGSEQAERIYEGMYEWTHFGEVILKCLGYK